MKKVLITGACGIVAMLAATAAHAAVTVFGGGMARECYVGVESFAPARETLEMCDLALTQERLNARDRAATHVNRGILHMRAGRMEMALRDYERSARIKPDLADAQVNRGAALYNLSRYPEAMEALNRGVEAENLNARSIAFYNRGLTHEKLGDVEAAYYDFSTALELNPMFELASRQLERFEVVVAED